MRILPAVYNIHHFNADVLTALRAKHANFDAKILESAGQEDPALLTDMATGKTVTRSTALGMKAFLDGCGDDPNYRVAEVRASPGSHLGFGPASENETIY
jgi:hypothetical protein